MSKFQEGEFHQAMLDLYTKAAQLDPPYRGTRLLAMIESHGGKVAADQLLSSNSFEFFTELFLLGGDRGAEYLKLSVEYLVLQKKWQSLFTDAQLNVARKRLKSLEVALPDS